MRGPNSGQPFSLTEQEVARFWNRVDKSSECWLWQGSTIRIRGGLVYGTMMLNSMKRPVGAHRIACYLANGPIPTGMCVCHRCDNALCVRPDHLFLGTHRDNMRDMREKNRAPVIVPDRRCPAGHFFTSNVAISADQDTCLRSCALCYMLEEQKRARTSYYDALSHFSRHVADAVLPLLPSMDAARSKLNLREFDILARNLGVWEREAESSTVLAYAYGVSRQRIEQIRDAAMQKLGVSPRVIDNDLARRFGVAAASVNVIPSNRKRKNRVVSGREKAA